MRRILHQITLSSSLVWVSWKTMTRKEVLVTGARTAMAETHSRRLQEEQVRGFTVGCSHVYAFELDQIKFNHCNCRCTGRY